MKELMGRKGNKKKGQKREESQNKEMIKGKEIN